MDNFNPLLQQGNSQVPIPQIQPPSQTPQLQAPQIQPTMSGVVNGDGANLMGTPPSSSQELDQRKATWSQMLDDPNMKSAIFRMGLNLIQGQRPGESALGSVGRAGIDAMDYYGFKNELDRKRAIEQQKLGLETARTNADVAQSQASTAATQQTTQQNSAKFDEWLANKDTRQKTALAEVDKLTAEGKSAAALAKMNDLKAQEAADTEEFARTHPELDNQAKTAALQLPLAKLAESKANATRDLAAAGASSAEAKLRGVQTTTAQQELDATPGWVKALPDEEAKLYAQAHPELGQQEVLANIAAGLHHGLSRKEDKAGNGLVLSGIDGAAQTLLDGYMKRDAREQNLDIGQYAEQHYTPSLTPNYGNIVELAKQKFAQGGGGGASGKVATEADIAATMKGSGKSRAEVITALQAKGYTIK